MNRLIQILYYHQISVSHACGDEPPHQPVPIDDVKAGRLNRSTPDDIKRKALQRRNAS